jgi:L-ascorbate metabolism protein UlaG (beta-lactamase superfamily)
VRRSILLTLCVVIALAVVVDGTVSRAQSTRSEIPIHHLEQGFRNLNPAYAYPLVERAKKLVRRSLQGWPDRGTPLEVLQNDGAALRANGVNPTITWIGHSTFLVQVDGINILTDPNWNDRVSPVSFVGPRRLVAPGLRFEDLPKIDAVVISHDHYDHLDEMTVRRLAVAHGPRFFVPLGLKPLLVGFGATDVVELDWWGSATLRTVTFTATPAQHSSGRGLRDQNLRLWSSWVVAAPGHRLFFAGDTGYFEGFKEIGSKLGPFQAALLPIRRLRGLGQTSSESPLPRRGRAGVRGPARRSSGADALGHLRPQPGAVPRAAHSPAEGGAAAWLGGERRAAEPGSGDPLVIGS